MSGFELYPVDIDCHCDERDDSDERAERDALRREEAEDAREMRETGIYNQRDYEMDVNA